MITFNYEKITAGNYSIIVNNEIIGSVYKNGSQWIIVGANGEKVGIAGISRRSATEAFINVLDLLDKKEEREANTADNPPIIQLNGHEVISVTDAEAKELDVMIGNTYDLKEVPEFAGLADGYYKINGEIFYIDRSGLTDSIVLPLSKTSLIGSYIEDKWEAEYAAKDADRKAEAVAFEQDMDDKEIDLGDGKKPRMVQLKNWKGRTVHIKESDNYEEDDILEILVNGKYEIDLFRLRDAAGSFTYSCYDGVNTFPEFPSPKRAIKAFLEEVYPRYVGEDVGQIAI